MQILFHLGAHETDDGLLIRSVLKNRAALAEAGIIVPGPSRYRDLLREVTTELRGQPASADTTEMVLSAITEDERAERLILSNENFLCRPTVALSDDAIYPKAYKAAWLAAVFPGHDVEFALSICNPATFIPKILRRQDRTGDTLPERVADLDLDAMRWTDTVTMIRNAVPGARVLVWCNEDTPLIWSDLVCEVAGVEAGAPLAGRMDRLTALLRPGALSCLETLLDARADAEPEERWQVIAGFLDAHATAEAVEEVIDLPGWTDATVEHLSAQYEEDVEELAALPGVEFIG